jgi:hypothetical protein
LFLPAGAGEFAGVQRGGRGFPVDHGQLGAGAGNAVAGADEPAEVLAAGPGSVGDDQPGPGFQRIEAFGSGASRAGIPASTANSKPTWAASSPAWTLPVALISCYRAGACVGSGMKTRWASRVSKSTPYTSW